MAFIFSLFVIGVGAVLRYALTVDVESVDLDVVGLIVMLVGAASAVASGINWVRNTWFAADELHHEPSNAKESHDLG